MHHSSIQTLLICRLVLNARRLLQGRERLRNGHHNYLELLGGFQLFTPLIRLNFLSSSNADQELVDVMAGAQDEHIDGL